MATATSGGLDFWDHVRELRVHLIAAASCFALALAVALALLRPLIAWLAGPLAPDALVFLSPLGPFAFQMRVATLGALLASLGPWGVLLVSFVAPALSASARRATWAMLLAAWALAALALAATQAWVMPWSLVVLRAQAIPGAQLLLTGDAYLDLFMLETLFITLLLELPLILAVLSVWGLVDPRRLARHRPPLYLLLLVAVAVITPTTDVVSLLLAMIPATLSLEIGLLAMWLIHSRRRRPSAAALQ